MFNDNVFHLNMKKILPLFKVVDEEPEFIESPQFAKMKNELAHRLLTVCTVYDEFPYIQYQGKSSTAKSLAESL